EVFVDVDKTASERDRLTVETRIKVDDVALVSRGDHVTERPHAAVGVARDCQHRKQRPPFQTLDLRCEPRTTPSAPPLTSFPSPRHPGAQNPHRTPFALAATSDEKTRGAYHVGLGCSPRPVGAGRPLHSSAMP